MGIENTSVYTKIHGFVDLLYTDSMNYNNIFNFNFLLMNLEGLCVFVTCANNNNIIIILINNALHRKRQSRDYIVSYIKNS